MCVMEQYIPDISIFFLNPERLDVAIFAIVVTAIMGIATGPLLGNANAFVWVVFDKVFGGLGGRLDRTNRSARELVLRGLIFTVLIGLLSYALGLYARKMTFAFPLSGFMEVYLLSLLLTSGAVFFTLLRLFFAIDKNKTVKNSYYALAHSARADLSAADDYTITRVGMGYAAFAFDKGLVAPVFWYLMLGLPGAFLYSGLSMLAWRFGKEGFSKGFGRVPIALEAIMGFVPQFISGILFSFAGLFTPTGGFTRAFIGQYWGGNQTKYAQGGFPLKAMAHSLKVSLGGPVKDLNGSTLKREWVGPSGATAQLSPGHLRRAIYMYGVAVLLLIALLGWAILWTGVWM